MIKERLLSIGTSGLILAAFGFISVLILALVYAQTEERIKDNQRQALLKQLNEIVAAERYDNILDQRLITLPTDAFNTKKPVQVYLATQAEKAVAAVFMITTMRGYSGAITLLVGVNHDQTISGVRVVAHRETPGLGDKIDLAKSDWIQNFQHKSLHNPEASRWAVKKDQGDFDQFTGATITPRAVVATVKQVLQWSQQHFDELFSAKYQPPPADAMQSNTP
jgi:electron transport complex protein RnfG